MRHVAVLGCLTFTVAFAGCGKKDSNGPAGSPTTRPSGDTSQAAPRKLAEGTLEAVSQHECVRRAEARVVRSRPTVEGVREDTLKAIASMLDERPGSPVLWVRLNVEVDPLIEGLRADDPSITGFKMDEFFGRVDGAKVIPVAPQGVVEVNGLHRFLDQDLLLAVPESAGDADVAIGSVSLARFDLSKLATVGQPQSAPSAHAASAGTPEDAQAELQAKLARAGVIARWEPDGGVLIVEGFPYRKDISEGLCATGL